MTNEFENLPQDGEWSIQMNVRGDHEWILFSGTYSHLRLEHAIRAVTYASGHTIFPESVMYRLVNLNTGEVLPAELFHE